MGDGDGCMRVSASSGVPSYAEADGAGANRLVCAWEERGSRRGGLGNPWRGRRIAVVQGVVREWCGGERRLFVGSDGESDKRERSVAHARRAKLACRDRTHALLVP